MTSEALLIWLLVGAVAGWLGGMIMRGHGLGLLGNIVVGIIGSVIGGWIFGQLGIATGGGILGAVVGATVGAVVLLGIIGLIRRRV